MSIGCLAQNLKPTDDHKHGRWTYIRTGEGHPLSTDSSFSKSFIDTTVNDDDLI